MRYVIVLEVDISHIIYFERECDIIQSFAWRAKVSRAFKETWISRKASLSGLDGSLSHAYVWSGRFFQTAPRSQTPAAPG